MEEQPRPPIEGAPNPAMSGDAYANPAAGMDVGQLYGTSPAEGLDAINNSPEVVTAPQLAVVEDVGATAVEGASPGMALELHSKGAHGVDTIMTYKRAIRSTPRHHSATGRVMNESEPVKPRADASDADDFFDLNDPDTRRTLNDWARKIKVPGEAPSAEPAAAAVEPIAVEDQGTQPKVEPEPTPEPTPEPEPLSAAEQENLLRQQAMLQAERERAVGVQLDKLAHRLRRPDVLSPATRTRLEGRVNQLLALLDPRYAGYFIGSEHNVVDPEGVTPDLAIRITSFHSHNTRTGSGITVGYQRPGQRRTLWTTLEDLVGRSEPDDPLRTGNRNGQRPNLQDVNWDSFQARRGGEDVDDTEEMDAIDPDGRARRRGRVALNGLVSIPGGVRRVGRVARRDLGRLRTAAATGQRVRAGGRRVATAGRETRRQAASGLDTVLDATVGNVVYAAARPAGRLVSAAARRGRQVAAHIANAGPTPMPFNEVDPNSSAAVMGRERVRRTAQPRRAAQPGLVFDARRDDIARRRVA